jgi:beta-lactam-binding protein with PASTA domain
LVVQSGRLSSAVGAWLKRAGLSPQSQQAYDEGEADTEAYGQLPQGSLLVFNGVGYAFA